MNANLNDPPKVAVPAVTPTIGAILGSGIAMIATPALGAVAPWATPAIVGFMTWLFHFAHSKLGTPE